MTMERIDEYHEQSRPLQTVFTRDDMTCKLNDRFAPISSVYTFPDERRKHYAQNLVYQVTRKASETGYIPILYTDADYQASNACYEKIGYILRGKLCTVTVNAR